MTGEARGYGVPAILARSRRLSGKEPVYELFGNEVRLTIYAADPAAEGSTGAPHRPFLGTETDRVGPTKGRSDSGK